jgi:hypothetical protein
MFSHVNDNVHAAQAEKHEITHFDCLRRLFTVEFDERKSKDEQDERETSKLQQCKLISGAKTRD